VGCSSRKINNISYLQSSDKTATVTPNLNVLFQKGKTPSVVLIFVHGGIGIVAKKPII
jgi:hypothetical protein